MQQHPYSVLTSEQVKGQLIFTPCPGTKDTSVAEALDTLKGAGASALLTLMPTEELTQNEVENLPGQCRQRDTAKGSGTLLTELALQPII